MIITGISQDLLERYNGDIITAYVYIRTLGDIISLIKKATPIYGNQVDLEDLLKRSNKIIDVGPGLSTYSWELAKLGKEVTMIEKENELVKIYEGLINGKKSEDPLSERLKTILDALDIEPQKLNIKIIKSDFWEIIDSVSGDLAIISYVMNHMGEKEFLKKLFQLYKSQNIENLLIISPRDSNYFLIERTFRKRIFLFIDYGKIVNFEKLTGRLDKRYGKKTTLYKNKKRNTYILLISKSGPAGI